MQNTVDLKAFEIDEIFSPRAIRDRAARIFAMTLDEKTEFIYNEDKYQSVVDLVLETIRENYPRLDIPFHSRWGHFRAGRPDRLQMLDQRLEKVDPTERARTKLDLVITSVLLDAGAGPQWGFADTDGKTYVRSEGLGIASLYLFMSGKMGSDPAKLSADAEGLRRLHIGDLEKAFQVRGNNPLVGADGRLLLLNNLAQALDNRSLFRDRRPGNILDYLLSKHGSTVPAPAILRAVLDGFGSIWPSRITSGGKNLGDVWFYPKLAADGSRMDVKSLVPFHKLSQWMTYSLIEPLVECGIVVTDVEQLTGLAEYRNGGLLIDSGLLSLRDEADRELEWRPDSELIIEWRALTIHTLDLLASSVQAALGKTAKDFPLAKVLEGGTWWAGRKLAKRLRPDSSAPLKIESDGTVF